MDFSVVIEKFDEQFRDEKYSRIMIALQVVSNNLIFELTNTNILIYKEELCVYHTKDDWIEVSQ